MPPLTAPSVSDPGLKIIYPPTWRQHFDRRSRLRLVLGGRRRTTMLPSALPCFGPPRWWRQPCNYARRPSLNFERGGRRGGGERPLETPDRGGPLDRTRKKNPLVASRERSTFCGPAVAVCFHEATLALAASAARLATMTAATAATTTNASPSPRRRARAPSSPISVGVEGGGGSQAGNTSFERRGAISEAGTPQRPCTALSPTSSRWAAERERPYPPSAPFASGPAVIAGESRRNKLALRAPRP